MPRHQAGSAEREGRNTFKQSAELFLKAQGISTPDIQRSQIDGKGTWLFAIGQVQVEGHMDGGPEVGLSLLALSQLRV